MKNNNNKSDPNLIKQNPWDNNSNNIWLASTISLSRNIEKFKFPSKLEADRQKQIVSLISKELLADTALVNPKLIRSEEISPLQKQYLTEHFLTQLSFQQAHSGEAFILEDTGEFIASLNIHDHIHLQFLDIRGELEQVWNRLVSLETALGKKVAYAFSQKYGYLTSDFNQCGTALNVAVYLQVPALVHSGKVDEVLEKLADDSIAITGIQGNPTEIIGDILVAQNNYTLGVTEENIIASLGSFTTKMLVEEKSIRRKILQEESGNIKDKVSRAFGILMHSYQIEAIEALNALSLLKLGIELKWMKGMTTQEINSLFLKCRRAHLVQEHGGSLKQEDIPHKRAEFIHNSLKNVQLII